MKFGLKLPNAAILSGVFIALLVPRAVAISTAEVESSISFTIGSSLGTLTQLSGFDNESSYLTHGISYYGNSNSGSGTALTVEGANSASASDNASVISSSSIVSLHLPPGYDVYGQAATYGQKTFALSGYGAATKFNLKINNLMSLLSLDLTTIGTGLYATASGQWDIQVSYSTSRGSAYTETYSNLSGYIGAGDSYSDDLDGENSHAFKNIPTNFTNLTVSWQTYAFAQAGDSDLGLVPDGGTTALLLGVSFVGFGLVAFRRKSR